VVPEVKKMRAGEVGVRVAGVEKVMDGGTVERRSVKEWTLAGRGWLLLLAAPALIWMMVRREGQALRCVIFKHFATATSSPTNAAALEMLSLYSMSLSTRSVVHGHRMMPLRKQAVASSHHVGMRGRITISTSPARSPRLERSLAMRCDEVDMSA